MADAGIEIGSHTCSHLRLSLASKVELARELVESKRRLEDVTGREVRSFCYPFGRPEDLNETVRGAVVDAGYCSAVVAYNDSRITDDLFALRRFSVGTDMTGFRRIVCGTNLASAQLKRYVTWSPTASASAPGAS
jgi:peptidoglycan/xylan/chitin deacetylase (PgdA/CDA1 family)